jgi:hypothetical protein
MVASFGATKGTKSSLFNLCRVQTIPVRLRLLYAPPQSSYSLAGPNYYDWVLWPCKATPNRRCGLRCGSKAPKAFLTELGTLVLISLAYLPCARQTCTELNINLQIQHLVSNPGFGQSGKDMTNDAEQFTDLRKSSNKKSLDVAKCRQHIFHCQGP